MLVLSYSVPEITDTRLGTIKILFHLYMLQEYPITCTKMSYFNMFISDNSYKNTMQLIIFAFL